MAGGPSTTFKDSIEALFRAGTVAGLSDGRLLDRFVDGPGKDAERAFEALVERHGPMVLRVCRLSLGDPHDAEDAAQATFLVLARQARSIRRADSIASWLHGVASRVAARARLDAARRRAHERRAAEGSARPVDDGVAPESWPELHEELARLPEKFRLPIVLCHLEGLSHEQAAQHLGCPVRTVQSRLARGRERLRGRLVRRGIGGSALLPSGPALPVMMTHWKQSTTEAAARFAAGGPSAASVTPEVAALAKGALQAMMIDQLKWVAAASVLLGAAAGGLRASARPGPPAPVAPVAVVAPVEASRVKLPDGTTVEVVGVSTLPTGPKTWWGPDGSPLAEAPVDPIPSGVTGREGKVRAILVRVAGLPGGATLKWDPADALATTGGRPTRGGERATGQEYYVAAFEEGRESCEVWVRVASGPWEAEGSHDGTGGTSFYNHGHKFYFGKARPHRGGTAIAVANNIVGRDSHLVAVDAEGHVHTPTYASGGGHEVLSLLDAEFQLPPERIREYRVESRPFEEATIQAIPLRPRK